MRNKLKLENWVYVFFMFQPLVNIYRTFFGDNIKIFGFSLFEMINTFFIIGLWMYVAFRLKEKKCCMLLSIFVLWECIA